MDISKTMKQYTSVGAAIKKIRKARGRTLISVQQDTGINISRLSRLENGKDFYVHELMLISDSLNVTPDVLLGYRDMNEAASEDCDIIEKAHRMRILEFDREEYSRMKRLYQKHDAK